MTHLKTFYF